MSTGIPWEILLKYRFCGNEKSQTNNLTLHPKELEKEEHTMPKDRQ